jgi:hypothetical protein
MAAVLSWGTGGPPCRGVPRGDGRASSRGLGAPGFGIKTLGVPVDEEYPGADCAVCGAKAKDTLRFARTY